MSTTDKYNVKVQSQAAVVPVDNVVAINETDTGRVSIMQKQADGSIKQAYLIALAEYQYCAYVGPGTL